MSRARRAGRPTLADVAARAGVSLSTTSRALGGHGYVSAAVRAAVLAAADELGYAPNGIARSMRRGSTRSIGFVGADIADPFFAAALRGISDVARDEGYETILTNSDERLDLERSGVEVLLEKQVDGMIVAPASVTEVDHLRAVKGRAVPLILLDRAIPSLDVDSVVIDNCGAARAAVDHLLDLGHTRVALCSRIHGASVPDIVRTRPTEQPHVVGAARPSVERIRGYVAAHNDHEVAIEPELLCYSRVDEPADERAARLHGLFTLADPPTAVFATDNAMTRDVLLALRSSALGIPDDISLVGFDDLDWTSIVTPPLTVVAQSPYDMGQAAARRLFARIDGDEGQSEQQIIPAHLVTRESTAPPRHRPFGGRTSTRRTATGRRGNARAAASAPS